MDTHKARSIVVQFAFDEHDKLLRRDKRSETDDAEVARFRRKPCFRNPLDCFGAIFLSK
jgi:hypothetical protein